MIIKFKRLSVVKSVSSKPGFKFEDYFTGTITINETGVLVSGCIKPQYTGKKEISVFLKYSDLQEIELEYCDGGIVQCRGNDPLPIGVLFPMAIKLFSPEVIEYLESEQ